MLEILTWGTYVAIALVFVGYIFNALKSRVSQWLWIMGSILWIVYSIYTCQWNLAISNSMCVGFCFLGLYTWTRDKKIRKKFMSNISQKNRQELLDFIRSGK